MPLEEGSGPCRLRRAPRARLPLLPRQWRPRLSGGGRTLSSRGGRQGGRGLRRVGVGRSHTAGDVVAGEGFHDGIVCQPTYRNPYRPLVSALTRHDAMPAASRLRRLVDAVRPGPAPSGLSTALPALIYRSAVRIAVSPEAHPQADGAAFPPATAVLSIAKLSASDAPGRGVRYYVKHIANSRDDYYNGSGEAPGRWLGTGAEALGLSGRVDAEIYLAIMSGRDPTTGTPLVPLPDDRLPGYDLTFSAPKSASLLWAFGDPEVAEAVRQAHSKAVAAALAVAEEEACFVRRGAGGHVVYEGGGFVAAAFEHRSSRAGDPHLHTHVVLANLTQGPDGRWSAPDGRPLYAWATSLGALYQAQLRAELAELGLSWDHRANGMAEVSDIPRAILRGFSRRRVEIEADQSRAGGTSARSAEVAQRRTRLPKDRELAGPADQTLRARWAAQLETLSVRDRPARVTDITGAIQRLQARRPADRTWLDGVAGELAAPPPRDLDAPTRSLTAHASTFSRRDVVRALASSCPDGASTRAVMTAAEDLVRSEAVVPLLPVATDPAGSTLVVRDVIRTGDGRVLPAIPADRRYSTPDLLAIEAAILTESQRLRDGRFGWVYHRHVAGMLAVASELSPDQAAVVSGLCRSGDGVQLVEGPAGSGKTTALGVARAAWEAGGYRVIGAALAARAAAELQSGSGIRSSTLYRLLSDLDRPGGGLEPRSVVVIDEAGMVGSRMLARLLAHTSAAGAKLVLVGDHHQLPEVDAGGAFRGLLSRLGALRLTENHRQAGVEQVWERSALDQLRSGDVRAALSSYEAAGRLARFNTAEEAYAGVISHWWELHTRAPQTSVAMMAVTNAEVAELNARARALRQEVGELGAELSVPRTGLCFAVGDRVVAAQNDARIDILNGTFGTVVGIDSERRSLRVCTDAGGELRVPGWYLDSGHLSHGYASTIHKAQGASVDVGLFLASESSYREAGYVALSRGRMANHLYALAPENHRWEIGHGRDGVVPPDPMETLVASLSRSKAQALAAEHLAKMEVTGVESGRRVWEARRVLGRDLAAAAPPDRSSEAERVEIYLVDAQTRRTQAADMVAEAKADLARAQTAARRDRRALLPEAQARLGHARGRLVGSDAELTRLGAQRAELAEAARRREAWAAANRDRIAAYREMGARLADWEQQLGVRAGYLRPEHVIQRIGTQPTNHTAARRWEMAAGAIEGYHHRWGIRPDFGLGPEPEELARDADWVRARERADRFLETERQRERVRGPDRAIELTA